jgi:hypothetical protein
LPFRCSPGAAVVAAELDATGSLASSARHARPVHAALNTPAIAKAILTHVVTINDEAEAGTKVWNTTPLETSGLASSNDRNGAEPAG